MADVVFVLGAGASASTGAPTMADFLDAAEDVIGKQPQHFASEDYRRVMEALAALGEVQSKAEYNTNNIESVLTAFEMAELLGTLGRFDGDQIPKLLDSATRVIAATLEARTRFPVERGGLRAPSDYRDLVELIENLGGRRQTSAAVITFNYDLALDLAITASGYRVDYALTDDAQYSPNSIPLLKLHGSLNWGRTTSDDIVPFQMDKLAGHLNISRDARETSILLLRTFRDNFKTFVSAEVDHTPYLIAPTSNKLMHQKRLANVWKRAARELRQAAHIAVVGYSLPETDVFFRTLYALATVSPKRIRSFEVYNPDRSLEQRFSRLVGAAVKDRFAFREATFAQAIPLIRQGLGL